jgi:phage N-6-adenine-methyltransferase
MSPTSSNDQRACAAVAGGLGAGPQLTLFNDPQEELTSDDYYTPKWIFDALDLTFDIDVASPPNGPPFTPCNAYFTKETNGLTSDWSGLVFMNPPFSQMTPWVEKFIDHANGIALLPMSKSRWFNMLWESNAAIVSLPSTLKFHDPKGGKGSIFLGTILAGFGDQSIKALANIGRIR